MKIQTCRSCAAVAALVLLSTLVYRPSTLHAQGSLTPPGAPAPTMKSLDQIEPRTIVNAANTPGDANNLYIITKSGSYYLTTNLVGVSGEDGIEILANNVTLDLNGFALQGVSGSVSGIYIPNAQTNITVRNGNISGWGNNGVGSESASSFNQVFERLNVSASGQRGVYLAGVGVVRDCNCQNSGLIGIECDAGGIISGCTANSNTNDGFYVNFSTMSGCTANNNTNGFYGYYNIQHYVRLHG